jgi:hypothetical protein
MAKADKKGEFFYARIAEFSKFKNLMMENGIIARTGRGLQPRP